MAVFHWGTFSGILAFRLTKAMSTQRQRLQFLWAQLRTSGIRGFLRLILGRVLMPALGRITAPLSRHYLESRIRHLPDRPIFVIKSTVDWQYPFRQRPHHLARAFANLGYGCIYVSPRSGYDYFLNFRVVDQNLIICYELDLAIQARENSVILIMSTDNSIDSDTVRMLEEAGNNIIYDYIDEIDEMVSRVEIPKEHTLAHEAILCNDKIYCVSSARSLNNEVSEKRSQNFALVTNGVDLQHFRRSRDLSKVSGLLLKVIRKQKPIIGYYGALAAWLDYNLIEYLALHRPSYEIVLIGPDYDGSSSNLMEKNINNLHFVPPMPYKLLPNYALWLDVCFIPFLLNQITQSTSPLKLFEYMALNKPIVSTGIAEARHYQSSMIGNSKEDFVSKIDQALSLDSTDQYWRLLRQEAEQNSWVAKAEEITDLVFHTVAEAV